jgi:hypothetical protein
LYADVRAIADGATPKQLTISTIGKSTPSTNPIARFPPVPSP